MYSRQILFKMLPVYYKPSNKKQLKINKLPPKQPVRLYTSFDTVFQIELTELNKDSADVELNIYKLLEIPDKYIV